MLMSTEQKLELGFGNFSEHTKPQNFTSAPLKMQETAFPLSSEPVS